MRKFLDGYKQQKLLQEIDKLNILVTSKETELAIKNALQRKFLFKMITEEFYKMRWIYTDI